MGDGAYHTQKKWQVQSKYFYLWKSIVYKNKTFKNDYLIITIMTYGILKQYLKNYPSMKSITTKEKVLIQIYFSPQEIAQIQRILFINSYCVSGR